MPFTSHVIFVSSFVLSLNMMVMIKNICYSFFSAFPFPCFGGMLVNIYIVEARSICLRKNMYKYSIRFKF
jgi:hypothetical protein